MSRTSSPSGSSLAIRQIDRKFQAIEPMLGSLLPPKQGWLRTLREALGMTLRQAAARLGKTHQSVAAAETAEALGSVTLNTLRRNAENLGCRLVYIVIPQEGTLDATLRKRARYLSNKILQSTAHMMALEDQAIGNEELEKQIEEMVVHFLNGVTSDLWED